MVFEKIVSVLSAGKVYEVCCDTEQELNEGVSIRENTFHRGDVVYRVGWQGE
jgi:hypothetical protein